MKFTIIFFGACLLIQAVNLQAATLVGLWEFNNPSNIGQATVGSNLTINGTAPTHSTTLADDASTSLGGVITTLVDPANRLTSAHGIAPNGGGVYVNEYSLLFDIFSPVASRSSWRTFFQTNTGNSNDGDYFIRNNNGQMGTADLGYTTGNLDETLWSRVVLTFDLGSSVRTYVNGSLFHTHTSQAVDGRYSLDPTILFFADQDGDNAALNVGTVAVWDGVLTAGEVTALGSAVNGVPEPGRAALVLLGLCGLALRRRR